MMLFSHIGGSRFITGAEKYLLMLAAEANRRFDCTLVVPEQGRLYQEAARRGLSALVCDIPLVWPVYESEAGLTQEVQGMLEQKRHALLTNLLLLHQPDLVAVSTCVNALPAIAAKRLEIPVAWLITEVVGANSASTEAAELIHHYSDWIVGISETALRPFRAIGLSDKLVYLPPTWLQDELQPEQWRDYRRDKRKELGLRERQFLIGYIAASLHPEKGLDHFIRMAVLLAEQASHVRFLIVGTPTDAVYMERCQRLMDESGCGERFHHIAFEARIQALFPAMDIVVVPSLVPEGFGMTAMEGLVFGKSVVAYRSGGLEEILNAAGYGEWLAEAGDVAGLTAKVRERMQAQAGAQADIRRAVESAFGIRSYRRRLDGLLQRFHAKLKETAASRQCASLPELQMNAVYRGETAPTVFLLEHGRKRPFVSEEAFQFYQYRWSDVRFVPDELLHRFPTGAPVSTDSPWHLYRPSVMLVRGTEATIYLLRDGCLYPFTSPLSAQIRGFDLGRTVTLDDEQVRLMPRGEPLTEHLPASGATFEQKGGLP
ncbi:glycosyltransferase family 4 protein [Paenibacillus doosanensis]|nr:glycosyltransferase family 4 protein [Paenibacillus doosanensis]